MATNLEVIAGDECECPCHRDPSIHHVMACCADCAECRTRVRTAALATHKPARCGGFRIGRLALRVDAVVCLLAGVALVVAGFTRGFMPVALHVVVGVLLALWGIGLWVAPSRRPLRAVLAVVLAVNVVAAIALVVVGLVASSDGDLKPIAMVAAVVVIAISAWEWVGLRRTQGSAPLEG
ncbi:MAG: hypothetical protein QM728_07480 [Gordonia sp. (in: high G+C Gram-positive bacteria)]|uniref:hypothetical protein n=1 Tax=Gordonia sp. (in: high G+C Gram-positive bacteria) TaxID=84139 RepID=UPI0039E4D0B6